MVTALRRTAVDHNIRLMHRLGHEQLFGNTLEAARGEKNPARLQAYVSIFEEYFTYWNASQKQQTLDFLYELLLIPDGDIRRRPPPSSDASWPPSAWAIRRSPRPTPRRTRRKTCPSSCGRSTWKSSSTRDRRLTPRQISMIRYQAKTAADALLMNCSDADAPRFAGELFRHYRRPGTGGRRCGLCPAGHGAEPAAGPGIRRGSARADRLFRLVAGTGRPAPEGRRLRLFHHLLTALDPNGRDAAAITAAVEAADCQGSTPLLFLQARLGERLGLDVSIQRSLLDRQDVVSNVFLDNLKTATHWVLKAVGVEYLLGQVEQGDRANVLHIATHFSNLMKVSENIVVRRLAGASLLAIAPALTPDRRNEVAVELSRIAGDRADGDSPSTSPSTWASLPCG